MQSVTNTNHFVTNLTFFHWGDGVESQSLQESPTSSSIVIPEDFESHKEMVRRMINVVPSQNTVL